MLEKQKKNVVICSLFLEIKFMEDHSDMCNIDFSFKKKLKWKTLGKDFIVNSMQMILLSKHL